MRTALVVVLDAVVVACQGAAEPPTTPTAPRVTAPPPSSTQTGSASHDGGGQAAYVFRGSDDVAGSDSRGVGSDDNAGLETSGHASGVGEGRAGGMQPRTPEPTIKLDPADVGAGGVDPAIVRRYLKRNVMKLRYCYERVLAHKPGLAGTVVATFTVGADGLVTKAAANGVDSDVASCMVMVIQDIEFPRGAHSFDVRFPIEVHPT